MRKNNYAAIYARVSTQAQEYDRQISELKRKIEQDGFLLKYIFEEKISGRALERPEFDKLQKLTNDDISRIYVWEISRLSRRAAQILIAVDEFADKGISIYFHKESIHTLNDDGTWNTNAKLVMGVFSSVAQMELETIRERLMSGRMDKVAKGKLAYTQRPPYGYDLKDGMLVINPEQAEVVKTIYDLFLKGFSPRKMEKDFDKGYGSIHKILKNVAYTGKRPNTYNPEQTLEFPQIISEETFAKVQELFEKRRTREPTPFRKDNPLSCKVHCSECGENMYRAPTDGTYRYCCRNGCIIVREDCILMNIDLIFTSIFKTRDTATRRKQLEKDIRSLTRLRTETQKQYDKFIEKEAIIEKKIKALMDIPIDTSDEQEQLMEVRRASKEKHSRIIALNNEIEALNNTLDDWERYNDWETIRNNPELWGKVVREQVVSITAYKLSHHYKFLVTKITGYPTAFGSLIRGKIKMSEKPIDRIAYITLWDPDRTVIEEEVMAISDPIYRRILPDIKAKEGYLPRIKDYDEEASAEPIPEELPDAVVKEILDDAED